MDAQLDEIIQTIKSEGIAEAEREAAEIKQKAEQEAEQIVQDAEKRAKQIIDDAKAESQKLEKSGKEALVQAGRDLILNVQNRITSLFDTVVQQSVAESYSVETVSEAVVALIQNWPQQQVSDLSILLPESQRDQIESQLRSKLSKEFQEGLEIKPVEGLQSGFRISVKDGSVYYDFSAEGIADVLSAYLNPRLKEIVKQASSQQTDRQ